MAQTADYIEKVILTKDFLTVLSRIRKVPRSVGAIAQLGERLHGMQEVGGSIPPSSTKSFRNTE